MEAQLKKRPIFKAPRPAGRRDALTPRAGADAAGDPFSSSDDDSQKDDEEAVLERLARPPQSEDEEEDDDDDEAPPPDDDDDDDDDAADDANKENVRNFTIAPRTRRARIPLSFLSPLATKRRFSSLRVDFASS